MFLHSRGVFLSGGGVAAAIVVLLAGGCGGSPPQHAPVAHGTGGPSSAPPPSVASADTILYGRSAPVAPLKGATEVPPAQAELVSPYYVVQFAWLAITTTIDSDTASALGSRSALSAAPGHEFILAHTTAKFDPPPLGPAGGTATITVHIGTEVRQIPGGSIEAGSLLAVSVPRGTDAVLQVAAYQRTQSLSLRTGKRGGDAIRSYYPVRQATVEYKQDFDIGSLLHPVRLTVDITDEALQPYLSDHGWAPRGKAWLVLHGTISVNAVNQENVVAVRLDLARSFRFTAGGSTAKARPGTAEVSQAPDQFPQESDLNLVVAAPETATTGRLTITPVGRCDQCGLAGQSTIAMRL